MSSSHIETRSNWSFLECTLIWAYSADVAPGNREVHSEQRGILSARRFLRGSGVYTFGREVIRCGPGEWLFTPEGKFHQKLSSDARHDSIRFRLHWPTGRALFPHERPIRVPEAEATEFTRCAAWLCSHLTGTVLAPSQEFRRVSSDVLTHLRIEANFRRLTVAYAELMRRAGVVECGMEAMEPRLANALAYINANIRHEAIGVRTLARRCGLSVSRFNRLFGERFGEAPSSFIARKRLDRVVQAVVVEGLSLKAAAYELGFGSPQNFSRWFKARTGMSPQAWFSGMRARG